MWIKVLSSFLFLVSTVQSAEHLSVVGPLVSKDGATYKGFMVGTEFSENYDAAVYFSCDGKTKRQFFPINSGESLAQEFEVTLDKATYGKCSVGSVVRKRGTNQCSTDQIAIISDPKSIVLIQTDKPLYKPNDLVRYQIVAIEDSTRPFKINQVEVDFFDGADQLIATQSTKDITHSDFGFHQDELRLAEEPTLGVWTMRVKINGFEQETNKTFTVKRYTLPPFKATIMGPSSVAYRDHKVAVKIGASYSFGKPVKGTARINATVINELTGKERGFFQTAKRVTDKVDLEINFKKDLKLMFLVKKLTLVLDVEFEEQSSGVRSTTSEKITLIPLTKYDFDLKRRPRFIPGLNYHVRVEVKAISTTAKTDETPLKLTYMFKKDDETNFGHQGTKTVNVQTGQMANFEVTPPSGAKVMRLKFMFDGEEYVKDVHREPRKNDENIQILPQEDEPLIDDEFKFTVEAAPDTEMSALTVLVMGKTGLIYSKNHPEADEQKKIEISIPITKEMAPEADLVVFYLKDGNGAPVYDVHKLLVTHTYDNELKIIVPSKNVKPGESVTIKAETEPNSLVAILGGDIALTFLGIGNLISSGYLEEKLSFDLQGYNFKLNEKHGVFGKVNGFIISPTTQKKRKCNKFEEDVLNKDLVGRLGSDFTAPSHDPITLDKDSVVRKNFPEIWIYDVQKTSSGEITLNKNAPDSITDFMINGFAMNKDKGFAVANGQKVSVFTDFFIKLEKPYSIQYGETVDIQVIIYNYMDVSGDATITLYNRKDQYTFISGDTTSQSLTTFVKNQGTASVTFTIQPKVSGKVFLYVDGKLKGAKDEIEDFILVESIGIYKGITVGAIVDLTERPEFPAIEWEFKIPSNIVSNSVSCKAHVSTSFVEFPAETLEIKSTILKDLPQNCGEQKMMKFATAISAKRFLMATGTIAVDATEKIIKEQREQGFQELVSLQLGDGSFDLWHTMNAFDTANSEQRPKRMDFLDLTIYIVKLLGQYEVVEPGFNKKPLDNAMRYISKKQRSDGSFKNAGQAYFRDLSKFSPTNGIALTSYAVIGILESKYLKSKHMGIVNKGLGFLNANYRKVLDGNNDYDRALLFYVYVLAGKDHKELWQKLEGSSIVDGDTTHWRVKSGSKYSRSLAIEASSYVILALSKLSMYSNTIPIVNFLSKNRDASGAFTTTSDTVIGFQALSVVSQALYKKNTKMDIKLTNQLGQAITMKVEGGDKVQNYERELSAATTKLTLTAKGSGLSNVQVTCTYMEIMSRLQEFFSITTTAQMQDKETLKLEVCTNTKDGSTSNMALMDVRLPSGFSYLRGPFEKVDALRKTEVRDDNSRVFFYFESLSSTLTCLKIEAKEKVKVLNRQDAVVTVSDYYERDNIGYQPYGIST